jgi:F-type H+-transporting ATPase subunit a
MGEHGSWTDLLYKLPGWASLEHNLQGIFGRQRSALIFTTSHFTVTHILWAFAVMLFVAYGALRFRAAAATREGVIPSATFNVRALFEMILDTAFGLMSQVMGEKNARRHFALIGSLALFILFSNLLALIPGAGVPTTTLKTNVGLALVVFLATHYYGIKEHGASYIKQFLGPLPVIAPLMFLIELISHIARPISLSLRLMGNMAADHKVVFTFFSLVPILVPVPFLVLGLLVCVVQTVVFCLLSMVYISMATAHDH